MRPELPPCRWELNADRAEAGEDLVAIGADLAPETLVTAYAQGLFPMGIGPGGSAPIGWWSPDPRGILTAGDFRPSRSLRRSERAFTVTVDRAFGEVMAGCADPRRPHGWITPEVTRAYRRLHELGWAHSVEVWSGEVLAGGLYGVVIGGLFAAESKFHRVTDASKAAVHALADWWLTGPSAPERLVDVQWCTEHLASLGVREVRRAEYRERLAVAVRAPGPAIAPGEDAHRNVF